MVIHVGVSLLVLLASGVAFAATPKQEKEPTGKEAERTSFQSSDAWNAGIDIQTDVAMVYGIDHTLPARLQTWKDHGYIPQVMTGVSWGEYQDYLYGRFDGVNHEDAAQQEKNGTKISHGGDVYYMVPEEPFGRFLCVGVKRAIDAGATAIYMEEPEFWVRAGWSPAFQREWKAYFHEDWQAPDSSPEARYRSGQLKYYLYKRALAQVFQFVKDYSKTIGRTVRCYVPTHSMLNYASWGIVSPESSLATLPGCDGYISQTWTGTARTENWYNGVKRERTFETAYLEYGSMHNLARATGRRMTFLADPIEDNPDYSWANYKVNYEQTLTASLLWPDVTHFEVIPWPQRVFHGHYPKLDRAQRAPGEPVEKEAIPPAYATELMTCFETLKHMKQADVEWHAAAHGVGVLVSDTLMFHRGGPSDPSEDLSHVYGALLPLLKRGVAVEPVQLENTPLPNYLKPYKVLYLSYVGQKPMSAAPHDALAAWVKAGGVLVVMGRPDAFARIRDWWNAKDKEATPEDDLMRRFGFPSLPASDVGKAFGKGMVIYSTVDPRDVAEGRAEGPAVFQNLTEETFKAAKLTVNASNALWLRRGPYVVGAVMEETASSEPLHLKGTFVDLFDAELPVLHDPVFEPGRRFLLLEPSRMDPKTSRIVASSSRIAGFVQGKDGVTFQSYGPENVPCVTRARFPVEPGQVHAMAGGQTVDATQEWDASTHTVLLRYMNRPQGVTVTLSR